MPSQSSFNIPQIIAVALVSYFAIRWFLQKPSGPADDTRAQGGPSQQAPATSSPSATINQTRQDLISRYGLQDKVLGKGKDPLPSEEQLRQRSRWSSDKAVRAEGLKKRREEMILAARRNMENRLGGPS
ncbi:hypothetical protein K470DRAFT_6082 [Piedraia hortae CBS 480.64]|uniref:CUE domain-containing protein n=1 Tax=Piedraia hortae CBS 480.64 TaxID=1314780 RepID=A0A6A7CDX9_9PEZI|nr:hypothetical protein K470DRAFT_6082 [Piedraia hortae CBS 480.64]